jgi:hypothetical protein
MHNPHGRSLCPLRLLGGTALCVATLRQLSPRSPLVCGENWSSEELAIASTCDLDASMRAGPRFFKKVIHSKATGTAGAAGRRPYGKRKNNGEGAHREAPTKTAGNGGHYEKANSRATSKANSKAAAKSGRATLRQMDVEEGEPVLEGLEGEADEDEGDAEDAQDALGHVVGVILDVGADRLDEAGDEAGDEADADRERPIDVMDDGAANERGGAIAERAQDG